MSSHRTLSKRQKNTCSCKKAINCPLTLLKPSPKGTASAELKDVDKLALIEYFKLINRMNVSIISIDLILVISVDIEYFIMQLH